MFKVKIETAGAPCFSNTMADYANAKYIIYLCWKSKVGRGTAEGSIRYDVAQTVAEAEALITMYEERPLNTFHRKTDRYIYIQNKPEWWTRPAVDASSQSLE